jgi:hypothetical protein
VTGLVVNDDNVGIAENRQVQAGQREREAELLAVAQRLPGC